MQSMACDADAFASTLAEMLGGLGEDVVEASNKAVSQSARKCAKDLRGKPLAGRKPWSAEYTGGFASHVEHGVRATGEVGNKAKPGLVHLLEKGHATPNGRRTAAYPHMKPALAEMEQDFARRMDAYVDAALGG